MPLLRPPYHLLPGSTSFVDDILVIVAATILVTGGATVNSEDGRGAFSTAGASSRTVCLYGRSSVLAAHIESQ